MPGKEKKLIAFTLYPGVTPLDLVGPLTVLREVGIGWPVRTVVVGERVELMATPVRPRTAVLPRWAGAQGRGITRPQDS